MKNITLSAVNLSTEDRITGIQRACREIILRIDKLLPQYNDLYVEYIYNHGAKNNIIGVSEFENIKPVEMDSVHRTINQLIYVPRYIKKKHSKGICISLEMLGAKGCVNTIYDLRPLLFRNYDSFKFRMKFRMMMLVAKMFSKKIVTDSDYQKNDIVKYLKVKEDDVITIYMGWEHMNSIQSDDSILHRYDKIKPKEYYFALGSLAPHKNFKWIIEVAKRNPHHNFVIAGGKNLKNWKDNIETRDLKNVIFTGYITDGENKALMQNCKAFLFPSKYEGFGIPPLEALACGAPIIISNATCLPEIYEDCARYFDPDDYEVDLDELLNKVVASPEKVLSKCSWDRAAMQWLEIMRNY